MVKKLILSIIAVIMPISLFAQRNSKDIDETYRRSSLYSLLVNHKEREFYEEINDCFHQIPTPDAYNDHNLSVRAVYTDSKKLKSGKDNEVDDITSFLNRNKIASRLVGKWFDYNPYTGDMDMDIVQQRGLYGATEMQRAKAAISARGSDAVLADAGEDLIGNTFVLVNDISYIDKSKGSAVLGALIQVAGAAAAASTGNSAWNKIGKDYGDIVASFKGFKVRIRTYLYQLVWDEEAQANVYNLAWNNREVFEGMRDKFKLKYIGYQESSGSTTSFLGIREDQPELMVRKACQRALDENIANLQKNFPVFQVKSPLDVETMEAKVGMKEGITEKSIFEVLERVKTSEGKIAYKKVGEVKPVKNLIWDNRYMAEEEMAQGSTLGGTTFKKVSGSDFTPGCLIRQIK